MKKEIFIQYKTRIFLFLFLLISSISYSQNFKFKHLTTNDGLSSGNVWSIIKDSKGYMWFGTEDGLNKFDGYNFTVYRHNPLDSTSVSDNIIQSIIEYNNEIWVGTRNGLNRYNYKTNKFKRYFSNPNDSASLSSNIITNMLIDKKGKLWIATNSGFNLYNPATDKMKQFRFTGRNSTQSSAQMVRSLACDSKNTLWLSSYDGIYQFDPEKLTFKKEYQSLMKEGGFGSSYFNFIYIDKNDNFWIGEELQGLFYLDRKKNKHYHFYHEPSKPNSLCHNEVNHILEDNSGNIWLSTNDGLSFLKAGSDLDKGNRIFSTILYDHNSKNGLSTKIINLTYLDRKKNRLWIGGRFGDLDIIDLFNNGFESYKFTSIDQRFSSDNMTAMVEDKNGNIWFGSDGGGIYFWDRKNNTYKVIRNNYPQKNSLTYNKVLALCADSYDNLWIGMWNGGVDKLNLKTNTFKHYQYKPSDKTTISSNNVFYIKEDSEKNIWIGLWNGGINLYNPKANNFIRFKNGENSDSTGMRGVTAVYIYEDRQKTLWIGSESNGLNSLNKKTHIFTHYVHSEKDLTSISNNGVNCIYEDSRNLLWIGTKGGLNLFDRKTKSFKRYSTKDGLPNDIICGILEDKRGNLWLSTNIGISKAIISPKKGSINIAFKNYSKPDGLQDNQFNIWSHLKTRNGELIFGGINGVTIFQPDSIKENTEIPPVVITGFSIFNQPVTGAPLKEHISETKEITLTYKQSVISFEYAALNYVNNEKSQYAYKMEGFENNWNYVGTERKATYTNLNPGKYVFRVKGSNSDGYWNNEGTSVTIIIQPPWWETLWFLSLLALVALFAIVYLLIRFIKTIKRQASQTILNERNQLKTLINNTPDGIIIKDTKLRYIILNKSIINFFGGKSEAEFVGKTDYDIYPKEYADVFYKEDKDIITSEIPFLNKEEKRLSGGKEITIAISKYPIINLKKEIIGLVCIVRDITIQKQTEEKLLKQSEELKQYNKILNNSNILLKERQRQIEEKSEEMEAQTEILKEANALLVEKQQLIQTQASELAENNKQLLVLNATKDKFFSIIAHDLRNPFNTVIGFSEILLQNFRKFPEDKIEKFLGFIHASSLNGNDLLSNLLMWSRSQSGKMLYNPENLDLSALVDDTLHLLEGSAHKKGILLLKGIEEELICKIDENMMKTIIRNLVSNAIKFTPENGKIAVCAQKQEKDIVVSVSDTGTGIPKEKQAELFKIDTNISTKGTNNESGTGLGLILCKEFVEKHGGKIWVESEEGKGSEFFFTIPFY
jgi:PAS domain S-box-containing protein